MRVTLPARYFLIPSHKETGISPLNALAACAGSWRGTSTLQDPHAGVADESPSTATVTPGPDGVRRDYTWSYRGKAQQGSLQFGTDDAAEAVTARWTDTWHMGGQPMACCGPMPSGNTLSIVEDSSVKLNTSYAA